MPFSFRIKKGIDSLGHIGYISYMVNFLIKRMPDELHRSFKAACATEGITMREKVMELIREYVEKQERKKAKK